MKYDVKMQMSEAEFIALTVLAEKLLTRMTSAWAPLTPTAPAWPPVYAPEPVPDTPPIRHPNIRGGGYYH